MIFHAIGILSAQYFRDKVLGRLGAAMSDALWANLDAHVRTAWMSKRLSDGTRLNLGATDNEQGFAVSTAGTRAVVTRRAGWQECDDNSRRRATVLNLRDIFPDAGGHTHPLGSARYIVAGIPGDEDGQMAARTRKPAYVISAVRAFAIEQRDVFVVRRIAGRRFSSAEKRIIDRRIQTWGNNQGASGVTCRFTPDS